METRRSIVLLSLFVSALLLTGSSVSAATVAKLYPSAYGTDRLPDGMLIKQAGTSDIYIIQKGRRSPVFRAIFDRWAKEAHYFKEDAVITLSAAAMKKYPLDTPRNTFYMGRILSSNGQRFFIDDKLRRRPMSDAVRAALHYPGRNVYTVPASLLQAFPLGPAITRTDRHPGGTIMYYGPYHGGIVYLITGDDTKREFLQDYAYETMHFPWSSQILPTTAAELARYKRGAHISTYPDGWLVGKGSNVYLTQNGQLRWFTNSNLVKAMGYNPKYILRVFPEFLKNYASGQPVTAFGGLYYPVSSAAVQAASGSAAAGKPSIPNLRVPPATQKLIANINAIFLGMYDRNPSDAENKFWVDYLYKGEAQSEAELLAALKTAKATGKRPAITSRDAVLPPEKLKHYVNFLFYFVFGRFPDAGEKAFWDGRIDAGVRKTITDLGGNMQYYKDQGKTTK